MKPDTIATGATQVSPWRGWEVLAASQFASLWEAPIGIAFLDGELRFVRINKALADINGLPPEAHIGRSMPEVLPETPSELVGALRRVLSTGLPLVDIILELRTPATGDEDHHYLVNYHPVRNDAGDIIGLGATVQDITRWRETERALQLSEERFRSLVLSTAQVVWTTDAEGRVVEDSPSWRAFTGQTVEQWMGIGWFNAVHPEDRPRVRQVWLEAVAQRKPYLVEYRVLRPDGRYTPTLARGTPVFNADGSLREWVGINTDISASQRAQEERERLLEELRQAVRARDEFLTVAAHELRTPLTTLTLRLHSLWRDLQAEPGTQLARKAMDQFEAMRRQVKRLSELVDGLLDVNHLEGDRLEVRVEHLELCTLAREVADRLAGEATRAGCTLEVEAECEVPGLWDRKLLEQVLFHLLSNALKYGAGRPVRLRVSQVEGCARLTVRDEGIGIAPEDVPRIFGRYERAVSERHYGGLGLGLYMTRRFVEALGGTVRVESTPGAGATFTVELPPRPPSEEDVRE
ncbi:sensor histidine kinase [Archangium lipolyticum]|uniref:sensor histidine kinase n=1 Tax=Archangium lipolyticum TaxID=2970465 RepID=UPI002149E5D3|nr:PAS domain-containing protein [Archangium lipolyticum]